MREPVFARRPGFARALQRRGVGVLWREEKDLDEASGRIAAVEARRADGHVVAYEEVARAQKPGELGEPVMRGLAASAVEDQEATRSPRPRLLGDALGGQVVVEEVDAHRE